MTSDLPWLTHIVRPDRVGLARLAAASAVAVETLDRSARQGPRSQHRPAELRALIRAIDICPELGESLTSVLVDLGERVWTNGVSTAHPACVAHFHSPSLVAAAVTEIAIAATNQSMDSWDQAPAATELELHLLRWLASELGLPESASGVMTPGGTASNVLGLTLARSRVAASFGHDVLAEGLPPDAHLWRIIASDQGHFSLQRAAAQLGLGRSSVIPVSTDTRGRMDVDALDVVLRDMDVLGLVPVAMVATAGTTDFGAVDPIDEIALRAADAGCWLHVDAAVGGAFVLSDRLRPMLTGIQRADSVTVDFHKLWFQPISASALIARDEAQFEFLRLHSAYLDRGDEPDGVVNLVGRSLDTSRRFDAAKVVASLRTLGRQTMGAMLEHLVDLTAYAACAIDATPSLRLLAAPSTVTCLFDRPDVSGSVLCQVQQRLLERGEAVIGRTIAKGQPALKLTLINPMTTKEHVYDLVQHIAAELDRVCEGGASAD